MTTVIVVINIGVNLVNIGLEPVYQYVWQDRARKYEKSVEPKYDRFSLVCSWKLEVRIKMVKAQILCAIDSLSCSLPPFVFLL